MKRKICLALLSCIVVGACVGFSACFSVSRGKKEKIEAPSDIVFGDITATSVTVIDCKYDDEYGHNSEVRIEGGDWIYCDGSEPVCFDGLNPLTEYTVQARQKAGEGDDPSESISRKVTTLRGQTTRIPENITYDQANGTITLKGVTGEMEVSYDGGLTYTDKITHTFTVKGRKDISIRYKETQTETAGKPLIVKFLYSSFYGGTGEETNPFLIESYEQLIEVSNNAGNYFKLIKDINYPSSAVTEPIRLSGTLDGNNKKIISPIIDFTTNDTMWGYGSVFATNAEVSIYNLTVENANVKTNQERAYQSILINNAKKLKNCNVSGKITINCSSTNEYFVGALCARLEDKGEISGCSADLTVETVGTDFSGLTVGGLTAAFKGSGVIEKSQAKITVKNKMPEYMHIGGLVGEIKEKTGNIIESKAELNIDVVAGGRSYIGGIVGCVQVKTDIENSLSTGEINVESSGQQCVVSGIATGTGTGNVGSIVNCYSDVNMNLDGSKTDFAVGGIICYALGGSIQKERAENCLYAGTMTFGASNHLYAAGTICFAINNFEAINNFYAAQNSSVALSDDEAVKLENNEYLSVEWQKNILKLDANIWNFKDGALPELKNLS